jgi:hypothetical protein
MILDPIYKTYGNRDENNAGDMAGLLNEVDRLAVAAQLAAIYGHHFAKGNQAGRDMLDRASGSGVFARDADTIITMTPHENDGAFIVEFGLRNFAPVEKFVIVRRHPLMVRDSELNPDAPRMPANATNGLRGRGRPGVVPDSEFLALLAANGADGMDVRDWWGAVEQAIPTSRRNFMRRVDAMARDGLIVRTGQHVRLATP